MKALIKWLKKSTISSIVNIYNKSSTRDEWFFVESAYRARADDEAADSPGMLFTPFTKKVLTPIYNYDTIKIRKKENNMEKWISAIIIDGKGEKCYHQFDNEEELRYFLACNEDCKLERANYHEE